MKGTYKFYQNGELLATHENLITDAGKRLILRYLASQASSIGEALAFGLGEVAPTATDDRLTFETERVNIFLKNVDYTTSRILVKSTIPQSVVMKIYEVGIFSTSTNTLSGVNDSTTLAGFDFNAEAWVAAGTTLSASSVATRVGADSLRLTTNASANGTATLPVSLDLSGYSAPDTFNVAFYLADTNTSSISLSFINSVGGEYKALWDVSGLAAGYHIVNIAKSAFTGTGTPTWDDIVSLKIGANAKSAGTSVVDFDAVRLEDMDTFNPEYALVSRSVLGTPLVKTNAAPMDVEYAVEIDIL